MTSAECIHAAQPAHIILTQVHSFVGPAAPDPTLPLPEMPSQSAVTAEIYNAHPNLPVPHTRPYPYPYPLTLAHTLTPTLLLARSPPRSIARTSARASGSTRYTMAVPTMAVPTMATLTMDQHALLPSPTAHV